MPGGAHPRRRLQSRRGTRPIDRAKRIRHRFRPHSFPRQGRSRYGGQKIQGAETQHGRHLFGDARAPQAVPLGSGRRQMGADAGRAADDLVLSVSLRYRRRTLALVRTPSPRRRRPVGGHPRRERRYLRPLRGRCSGGICRAGPAEIAGYRACLFRFDSPNSWAAAWVPISFRKRRRRPGRTSRSGYGCIPARSTIPRRWPSISAPALRRTSRKPSSSRIRGRRVSCPPTRARQS